jgi:magnesium and cobalt transporter
MNDERSAKPDKPTLLERLSAILTREPEDRDELLELLHGAFEHKLLDADALSMIEGVLQVSEMSVRDIMVPRAQMDVVSIDDDPADFLPLVLETKHSRFPVIGENKDDVVGILLAKELLNYFRSPESFNLRDTLRPAVFVPESKRLNVLLRDFRANRNHIAIVVDEYGGVSGLVTIEDVLEQIVGDIEDEYDFDESEDNIIAEANGRHRVKAQTEIADFNAHFGTDFADDEFDTVGGLVLQAFGRLPKRGETATIGEYRFRVVRADSRRLYMLQVEPSASVPAAGGAAADAPPAARER